MTTDQDIFARPSIFAGARAPEALTCVITSGERDINLNSVSSVRFRVRIGQGDDDRIWYAVIVSRRSDKMTIRHGFDVDGVETRTPGRYRIIPELVFHTDPVDPGDPPIPDGIIRCEAFYLGVKP